MRYFRLFAFGLAFLVLLGAPADSARDNSAALYKKAADYYHKLRGTGRKYSRDKWMKSINLFKDVYTTSPKGSKTPEALYMTGKLYHELYGSYKKPSDKANAVNIFRVLVQRFPSSPLADDGLYMAGELHQTDGEYDDARTAYSGVLKWFPTGDMASKARSQITALAKRPKSKLTKSRPAERREVVSELEQVRMWSSDTYARVVFDLSKKVNYRITRNDEGNFLVIDLLGIRKGKKAPGALVPKKGMIDSVQVSDLQNGVNRVKISTEPFSSYTSMELSNPDRIVIDFNKARDKKSSEPLFAKKSADSARLMKGAASKSGSGLMKPPVPSAPDPALVEAGLAVAVTKKAKPRQASIQPSPGPSYAIKTIVLDPGHGGKDPGAIGRSGLKEKDVVLDVGHRLQKILRAQCHCRVLMTRTRDVFIPLEERTAFANTNNADLFISIHVNSVDAGSANGVETYFLSPARSKSAMYTAARENMMAMKTDDEDMNDITFILSDMQNTTKINESSMMASTVQKKLVSTLRKKYRTRNKGVKQAMFYVLHGAQMPSILIETAFISNRAEERRLKTGAFRQQLARGIADGVENFVRDTRVAYLAR